MSLFDVGIDPAVARAAGQAAGDGLAASRLVPTLETGLEQGGDHVAGTLHDQLIAASEPVGRGFGTGFAAGIDPTVQQLRSDLRTVRNWTIGLGVAALAWSVYKHATKRRRRHRP